MPIDFLYYLQWLGLGKNEATIYLTCLKLKQANVTEIGVYSGIQRTYVYSILKKLAEKGIVSMVKTRKKTICYPVPVKRLFEIYSSRLKKIETILPRLTAIGEEYKNQPAVIFFRGESGLLSAMDDTLSIPENSEILSYSSGKGFNAPGNKHQIEYIKKRIKKNIRVRAIAPDDPATRFYTNQDERHMRSTRLISERDFDFSNEINIYGNKISIVSLTGELLAVIIESESIANTQRAIFELAWRGAGK